MTTPSRSGYTVWMAERIIALPDFGCSTRCAVASGLCHWPAFERERSTDRTEIVVVVERRFTLGTDVLGPALRPQR